MSGLDKFEERFPSLVIQSSKSDPSDVVSKLSIPSLPELGIIVVIHLFVKCNFAHRIEER